MLFESYMSAELDETTGRLSLKFAELLKKIASEKKLDTKKKKPLKDLPDRFRCTSFLGHEILLFEYMIGYDCQGVLLD